MTAKSFFVRWQEYISWTPLLVILSVGGWIFFGALSRNDNFDDVLAALLELPIRTAYAAAALGIAYLARRRQRRHLTKEQGDNLWHLVMLGNKGAIIVYLTDALVWALAFTLSMLFFWPAR